jgi:hypothetical protein
MKVHKIRKARNLPFTVKAPDGTKKRFEKADEAWRYMALVKGQLSMAFRVF